MTLVHMKKLKQMRGGMQEWLHLWWEGAKRHWVAIISIFGILIIVIVLVVLFAYLFGWNWTGFNGGYPKVTIKGNIKESEQPPAKTLWDVLQLFAIPVAVAFGTAWLSKKQAQSSEERNMDNQREAALQAYIDKMSELLLVNHLRESTEEMSTDPASKIVQLPQSQQFTNNEAQQIARVRTLTVLRRLDKERKGAVLQFLQEANLIHTGKPFVLLSGADLSEAHLSGAHPGGAHFEKADLSGAHFEKADLSGAHLSRADLSKAHLNGAHLNGADLSGADLSGADLNGADLSKAVLSNTDLNLPDLVREIRKTSEKFAAGLPLFGTIPFPNGADLSEANLSEADLSEANLSGANLSGANLSRATATQDQWKQARSLRGTILPNGTKLPER